MSWTKHLLILSLLCMISCGEVKKRYNYSPDEAYLIDKFGAPSEELSQRHFQLINSIINSKTYRSPQNSISGLWTQQGPGNIGARVSAVAIHPTNQNIIYVGFPNGGVFKTTNGGASWNAIFDNQATLMIGAIAIDPKNSETIYVGTGDPDISGYPFAGNGIYKSTDGGKNWTNMGLEATRIISEILVDPQDSKVIFVAAMGNPFEPGSERGLFKSSNGGVSWEKVLFISSQTGITNIAFKPGNSQVLYAASWERLRRDDTNVVEGPNSRIRRSKDGGKTWEVIHNGIPDYPYSRIAIEVCKSNPEIIYARMVRNDTAFCNGGQQISGLYKSMDGGDNWQQVITDYNNSGLPCDVLGGFGWYFGRIGVNPNNPNDIFLLGVDLYRSLDGGISWVRATPDWWTYEVHADKHEIEFFENGDILLGTDGGLYKLRKNSTEWEDLENIATTQFYRVAYNPNNPSYFYGGAQDNGTSTGNAQNINNWEAIYGGDGFLPAFHPTDPNIYWCLTQNGGLNQTRDGGLGFERFTNGLSGNRNWDFPYLLSSYSPDIMYCGANRIFKNYNLLEANWKSISPSLTTNGPYKIVSLPSITCMDESLINPKTLIAGTNNGNVWICKDSSSLWMNVTSGLPPGYVTSVKCSKENDSTFYVSLSNYRNNSLNSLILRSRNNGKSWESISGGELTEIPVYDLQIIEAKSDIIMAAATLLGVYVTNDKSSNWKRVGDNMPLITVNDLDINIKNNQLIAGTYARSIMTFPLSEIKRGNPTSNEVPALKALRLEITPNPADAEVVIDLPKLSNGMNRSLRIMDLNGQTIINIENIDQEKSIYRLNLQGLNAGIYLAVYQEGQVFRSRKLQKI
ncbi:MAG: T9SS type A sorting domain-containing protein [Saprospiraceae bacterium]|nr:T9SS type A sorting domain-containing protein [Candidatus Vicinibacter affinis]